MITSSAYPKPEPCNLPKTEIERIAAAVAKNTGYAVGGDLRAAVEQLGGSVSYLDWQDWFDHAHDTIQVDGPQNFRIRLLSVDGPLRHRFTIAHELGHYVLHSRLGKIRLEAGRKGSNRTEWEANWFAAALLMPEAEFRDAVEKFRDRDSLALALSGHFMVSLEAAEVRLKTLGLSE